jgi:hypothetical protein
MTDPTRPLGKDEMLQLARRSPPRGEALRGVESLVSETVWTRRWSGRWWLSPAAPARRGIPAGADFKRPPRRRRNTEEYGYDRDDRLLVSRRHEYGDRSAPQVFEYQGNVALARNYDQSVVERLDFLIRYAMDDDGRVVLAEHAWPDTTRQYVLERFVYDESARLRAVEFERDDVETRINAAYARGVQRLDYDDDGELMTVIQEYASGRPAQMVWGPLPDDPEELAERTLDAVLDAIRRAVAATQPDESMCLLALRYVHGGAPLPPMVDLCSDARWHELAAHSADPGILLSPPEWRGPELELDLDAETVAACAALERWADCTRGPDLAPGLAKRAAAILGGEDWSARRAVTDDFAVYAVDIELEDLAASIPAGRARELWDRAG